MQCGSGLHYWIAYCRPLLWGTTVYVQRASASNTHTVNKAADFTTLSYSAAATVGTAAVRLVPLKINSCRECGFEDDDVGRAMMRRILGKCSAQLCSGASCTTIYMRCTATYVECTALLARLRCRKNLQLGAMVVMLMVARVWCTLARMAGCAVAAGLRERAGQRRLRLDMALRHRGKVGGERRRDSGRPASPWAVATGMTGTGVPEARQRRWRR